MGITMRIQPNQVPNLNFNGLFIKNVDVDHARKFLAPIQDNLDFFAKKCDIHIQGTVIPVQKLKDAVIGKTGFSITVENLPEDRFAYALRHFFLKRMKPIKTVVSIDELNTPSGTNKLLYKISRDVDNLNGDYPLRFLYR